MSKRLDRILVIDVEATCWEGKNPDGQLSEIIEIGICVLETKTCQRIAKKNLIVKPDCSEVSAFCTRLTTLTPSDVDKGMSLKDACKVLRTNYLSQQCTWASYGDYDRRQFERECQVKKIGYPFGMTHLNVKKSVGLDARMGDRGNFTTRFALNAACIRHQKPLISGATIRFSGQITVFLPAQPDSPCYRCLYPDLEETAETCSQSGILAPLVGVIGSLQAVEIIKVRLNLGQPLCGRLLLFDAYTTQWRSLKLQKDPTCPVCS